MRKDEIMEYGRVNGYGIDDLSEMLSLPASRYNIVRIWLLSPENGSCRHGDYEFCADTDGEMPLSDFKAFFLEIRDALDADIDIVCMDVHDKNAAEHTEDRMLVYERDPVS